MKSNNHRYFYAGDIFSPLDLHFADFIQGLTGEDRAELFLAAALASRYTRQGHICLDLSSVTGKVLSESDALTITCPALNDWLDILRNSPVVGQPGEFKPLILDSKSRLYLYRYWEYENMLTNFIKGHVDKNEIEIDIEQMLKLFDNLFSQNQPDGINWQKIAVLVVLIKRFCIISGGPGTGKTTTVAKILAALLEQAETQKLRIALAAPTGKAAARMQDAIKLAKARLSCPDRIKEAIPEKASTIHRLLGSIPDSPYFCYNADNRLPVDVVVVDEASMVDLALIAKLVQALPTHTRLILLGDKDQLASVEVGAVFGDICDRGKNHYFSSGLYTQLQRIFGPELPIPTAGSQKTGLQDCIVHLQKNYRFSNESGIGKVSRAVNAGDGKKALAILKEAPVDNIQWRDLPDPNNLGRVIRDTILAGYQDYLIQNQIPKIFHSFEQFRVLCALREGPYGVVAMNSLIEQILTHERLIYPEGRWYRGRPVMITSNDYYLRLFNGDVGIVLHDPESNNEPYVFFVESEGTIRKFHPSRLPAHETVFAMTVHKSQGSEFDDIVLMLPDRDSPILTRELVYTGITRAKKSVTLWANSFVFQTAVSRRIERTSGLRDALWKKWD